MYMLPLGKKRYVYFDLALLQDEHCSYLLEEFASWKEMYVYVRDQAEEESAKTLDNFAYMNDVVYANEDLKQPQHRVCFITKEHRAPSGYDEITIGASMYPTVLAYIDSKYLYERKRRWIVNVILGVCMLYYMIYFFNMDNIPATIESLVAIGSVIPILVFALTIGYAIRIGIYRASILFSFLDLF